jgi:hypothetical protein
MDSFEFVFANNFLCFYLVTAFYSVFDLPVTGLTCHLFFITIVDLAIAFFGLYFCKDIEWYSNI